MDIDTATASILAHYRTADAETRELGARWYESANEAARRLAAEYGVTVDAAAGVIAALSPRQTWAGNLRAAETLLAAHALGLELPRIGLRKNALKAWRIAAGEEPLDVLGGLKVRSFYANILGDLDAVTVDVWAARAAGEDRESFTPAQYRRIASAYHEAARIAGLAARDLQAIVWVAVRGGAS